MILPLALLALVSCGDSEAETPAAATPKQTLFVDVTETCGIQFDHVAAANGGWVMTEIMGGGGALFDMDGDDDLDLLLLGGGLESGSPTSPPSGSGHGLFENGGQGIFSDVSLEAGFEHLRGYGMGAACGDVNGDGAIDLYITQRGPNALLLGDGHGRFTDVTELWNAVSVDWSSSATFVDFDSDGDLDLFVVRYIDLDADLECRDSTGRRDYCPPASGPPIHDLLLRNDGSSFTDVSLKAGLTHSAQPGLGVVAADITGDGQQEIYVTNDGAANQLWVRLTDGSWRDEAMQRGVALNYNGVPEASMGVVAEDFDGDQLSDLFMTHLQEETHTLYAARGQGSGENISTGHFRDRTSTAGLSRITRPGTGFGVAAFDLELDGDLDLAVAQGRVRMGPVHGGCLLTGTFARLAEPNLLLVNSGAGKFTGATSGAEAILSPIMVDRSVLAGDLDGDGDIDLVFTRNDGPAQVLRNDARREGTWIMVDPRETSSSATALGAVITMESGEHRAWRESRASDGYQSSRDPRVHFGLPGSPGSADVVIRWQGGLAERFRGCASGRVHRLLKGTGTAL